MVYVATLGRQIVGFVCCNLVDEGNGASLPSMGYIDLLAVNPQRQGQGLGKVLLREALRWLQQRSQVIEVRTQLSNGVSLLLYQREGFQILSHGVALPSGHSYHGWMRS